MTQLIRWMIQICQYRNFKCLQSRENGSTGTAYDRLSIKCNSYFYGGQFSPHCRNPIWGVSITETFSDRRLVIPVYWTRGKGIVREKTVTQEWHHSSVLPCGIPAKRAIQENPFSERVHLEILGMKGISTSFIDTTLWLTHHILMIRILRLVIIGKLWNRYFIEATLLLFPMWFVHC